MRLTQKLRDVLLGPTHERFERIDNQINAVQHQLDILQRSLGRVEIRQLYQSSSKGLSDREFQVFSQWGEDGIIQFLIQSLQVKSKTFIELGVEDYVESNTRFLLENNKWRGLVVDSSPQNIDAIQRSRTYWGHDLIAVREFITTNNVNKVIRDNGFEGETGLLSIDLDGNDYWIWKAIDAISPVIVVIEYNYRFGSELAVTIPYDERFERGHAHPSKCYFGASLKALCLLAKQKGYSFVGCGASGVNAFFVRTDKQPPHISELTPAEGYIAGNIAESFDDQGRFAKLSLEDEKRLLQSLPLVTVDG